MAFARMFSFIPLCVITLNQPEINSETLNDDGQRHPVGQCSLSSVIKTYARSGHLVVHRESLFVAYCVCGEAFAAITWTGNAVDNGRGSNQDVTFGRSKYSLSNVSKRDEGRLCCVQGEHSACLYLLVVDSPVVTLSDRTHVTCNNETLGKDTNAVSIQCNVSSHVEQDLAQGFMQVYINDVGTVSYDQTPSNGTRKDLAGNTVYTEAFEFREDMRNGDSLDCRWIREDGKIVKSNVQLVAKDHTCSVPTVSFTTIAASTVGSTNSTTAAMTSQNDGLIIGLTVPLTASVIVLLLIACYYRKEIGNKLRKRWPQPMNDLQRTNQNENHREEESTTVDLGLSNDDEGLEGSTNDATTQTSSHLPPSDHSPLGKKATLGNCLNPISETETGSRPTSEILNETENNVSPRRNTSIDALADKYEPAANCTDPQPLSTIDFQKSVLSELKTIRQQSEERLAMNDDRNERVAPAAPEERIQTAAYPMTNHDRPEQPAEVSLSSSANKMPTAAQIVAIALEADVLVKKEKLVALLDSDLFSTAIITVMEKEHRTEFQCTRAMLEMWCNEGQATCRTMIEALSKLKLTRIACKVFGKQLVENILR